MKNTFPMILLVALLVAGSLAAQETTPNFTGQWTLNPKLSDDMGKIMKQAMSGPRMQGGSRGGGEMGGGRGGRGGPPPGGEGGGPSDRMRKGAQEMTKRQSALDIFHAGDELNITDGLEITRLLHTDGRPHPVWTEMGEATAVATWHQDMLEVVWQNQRHPRPRTRRFALIDGGARLQITEAIMLPDQSKPTTINLVYDRQVEKEGLLDAEKSGAEGANQDGAP